MLIASKKRLTETWPFAQCRYSSVQYPEALTMRVIEKSGEMLMQMVGMRQRIDHEPAQKVLTILAGRDLGQDEQAWRRWWEQTRGNSVVR